MKASGTAVPARTQQGRGTGGVERPVLGPNDALLDEAFAARVVPTRRPGAHKWGVGGLVIVAGSPDYVGAAALCAQAAGRAGAGIVHLAVPRGIAGAIAPAVIEAAYVLLPETESLAGGRRAVELIGEKLERSAALVVGPGLGDDDSTAGLLGVLFNATPAAAAAAIGFGSSMGFSSGNRAGSSPPSRPASDEERAGPTMGKPVVIDADGLNWLAKQEDWSALLAGQTAVLTPHPGELARLTGTSVDELTADPVAAVRAAAKAAGQTVVFKYGYTAVSDGERVLVADDAPSSLASAGTGDVLAGTIGALLAQGLAPVDAAGLGVYLGLGAARRVERRTGTLGLVAGDLPLAIAEELAALEDRRSGDA